MKKVCSAAIEQLESFEAPAVRVGAHTCFQRESPTTIRSWLDNLCLAGVIGWGRISPHPAWSTGAGSHRTAACRPYQRRAHHILPSRVERSGCIRRSCSQVCGSQAVLTAVAVSPEGAAGCVLCSLTVAQPSWRTCSGSQRPRPSCKPSTALWELATAGLASADGFDQLRAMMDPRRKFVAAAQAPATSLRKRAAARTTAGRWSLLCEPGAENREGSAALRGASAGASLSPAHIAAAKRADAALEAHARILLCRYGVLFRELLVRESNAPRWRDLVPVLRRLEARGEIRGGRFVSGAFGEQYALAEAADGLRAARRQSAARTAEPAIAVAAADPLNLAGIVVPGERTPSIPGREVRYQNGSLVNEESPAQQAPAARKSRSIPDLLRSQALPASALRATAAAAQTSATRGLFP